MAMFQLEIAFLLELALFAGGLALLHLARQPGATLLRAAGAVLVAGSVLTAACSLYFGVRYHVQGEFDSAYPAHHAMTSPRGMMRHGMMGHGMTKPDMGGMGSPPAEPENEPDEAHDHEQER